MKIGILAITIWTAVLLALLLMPLPNVTPSQAAGFTHWDKVAHFGLFGVAGVISMFGSRFIRSQGGRAFFALSYGLFFAGLTEGLQYFTKVRQTDFCDLLADVAGLSTAIVLCVILHSVMPDRKHARSK